MFIQTRARANNLKAATKAVVPTKVASTPIRKKKRSKPVENTNTGRWEKNERIAFLRGFRQFGKGKWKQIGAMIPSRTTVQVKTHGQMVIRRMNHGEDVYAELDRYESEEETSLFGSIASESSSEPTPKRIKHNDSTNGPTWIIDSQDVDAARVLVIMRFGAHPHVRGDETTAPLMRQVTPESVPTNRAPY